MKMHARIDVSPIAQAVAWPRHANDARAAARVMPGAAAAPVVPDRARYEPYPWSCLLDRYLEGWAEANLGKIFAATTHGYCFDDPLVGQFSRWNFPSYFERLQERFARAGAIGPQDLGFVIRGPMDGPLQRGRLKFFREAPRLGLTGISFITISERGVIAENVAYDLNLACDALRDPGKGRP
jgi:hypothetical protein